MTGDPDNSAPGIITAHKFTPRFEWWTVCRVCGLAEAAHADTTLGNVHRHGDGGWSP